MNVVRWSPFREFDNFFQSLDRPTAELRRADWLPLVDIREREDSYQIDVEVPAIASDDLEVSVTDNVLSVSGERKFVSDVSAPTGNAEPVEGQTERAVESEGKIHRVERRYGRFVRNFQLPDDADAQSITAENKDGVLYLTIAKRAEAKTRNIQINVN